LFVLTGSNPDFHTKSSSRIEHRRFGTHKNPEFGTKTIRILDLEAAVLGLFCIVLLLFSDIIIVNKYIIK